MKLMQGLSGCYGFYELGYLSETLSSEYDIELNVEELKKVIKENGFGTIDENYFDSEMDEYIEAVI